MVHGPLPSGPAASTVVLASRARARPGWLCTKIGARPFRFARFPFRALGHGPVCPRRRAVPVPAPFVPFPGTPEPFLAVLSLEGPRLPVSPGRRPFGRRLGKCNGPADGWRNRTVLPCQHRGGAGAARRKMTTIGWRSGMRPGPRRCSGRNGPLPRRTSLSRTGRSGVLRRCRRAGGPELQRAQGFPLNA